MYFIFKLTIILLILYLKLNVLKTSPVIDRNKILSIDIGKNVGIITKNSENSTNNNNSNNNDNNIDFVFPVVMPYITNNINTDNSNADNANTYDKNSRNKNNRSSESIQQQKNTTSNRVSTNFTTIELSYLMKNYTFYHNDNSTANLHTQTPIPQQNATDMDDLDPTPVVETTLVSTSEENKTTPFDETSSMSSSVTETATEDTSDINSSDLGNNWYNNINASDIDHILVNYNNDNGDTCMLDGIKESFMWWAYPNGSLVMTDSDQEEKESFLDLSARNYSQDLDLYNKAFAHLRVKERFIIAFSAANNQLTQAPYKTLLFMSTTLKYLSLRENLFETPSSANNAEYIQHYNESKTFNTTNNNNNTDYNRLINSCNSNEYGSLYNFKSKLLGKEKAYIGWATFPLLPQLIELDISNCRIEYITKGVFENLTNLRNLYMSNNRMLQIPGDAFHHTQSIQYLDLSFTNFIEYTIPLPTLEAIFNLVYGVKISQFAFKNLPQLEYLDLSHTKLTRNSAIAFTHLSAKLKFLSLCYTAFPMIGSAIFKNTALIFLDLSGNPYASYNIIDDTFDGVRDTLKYLFFEKSNIKELDWLPILSSVRVLGLSGNNINAVSLETFSNLQNLQILDLSSNHVGNWYNRAFTNNKKLRVLNLRDNNINIITSEMLKDFEPLEYLGIGDNDFVCDCLLREMVEIAAMNNKDAECSRNVIFDAAEMLGDNINLVGDYMTMNLSRMNELTSRNISQRSIRNVEIGQAMMEKYLPTLKLSYRNIKLRKFSQRRLQLRFFHTAYRQAKESLPPLQIQCNNPPQDPDYKYEKLNSSALKFQLLDYEDEHYWCFNETQRMNFVQLNCQSRNYVDDLTKKVHTLTKYVLGSIGTLIGLTLIGVIIYSKRWHIHYYYSSLKSAALVSVATKEAVDKFNELTETDPNLIYDIFISYCQNDRQWVLEELLPNVEVAGDISICMHERDFQIGVTILDNITSCMDRSKALMLIISRHFLLSHWCQFEMHLAQHRMFEASKEHLILVFLEDIPRSRRPKTLQYLMEIKTYIKWPASKGDKFPKPEDKKLFWKRLKRSLENIGVNHSESRA